ncbi:hydroxymethylglutaryl-CoA lyase (plasmid) [Sphingobium sp. SJ10-10]|uniref:Hydroxymethylglutaryl-CoA lyase n=1 Tax=Sphingomonas sp. NS2 TaxID=908605 RepID=A0A0D4ZZK4_9SPHN|nr:MULTISPECIES: hydroxymethylglutaryl-CoA lyase [unclassified Sphingobium]AJW29383.1 Hydroxymethylglutaryl-CoA lyase [Sphingomonas sp. NS2]AMK26584.1 pyruvate carboxyltransferase [Sphingobium sp. TKS]MEC6699604.1 hydroxymethylglutaryl-CoA lyase [Sphingobium sp. SJ10-10]
MSASLVSIVEVGPRDGFQPIGEFIPTALKALLIDMLYDAGIRRMEATAFVSPRAVPQMADAPQLLAHCATKPGLDIQVLVPSQRQAERALAADARHLAFVLSVSPKHNQSNVLRTPQESVEDFRAIVALLPPDAKIRLNLATSFDCPFDGPVDPAATLNLVEALAKVSAEAEYCLCDTTGRVTPDRVGDLFRSAKERFPQLRHWAFHGHDTYGLGVANALAAFNAGVWVIDSSFGGLGGCPFAPGATGNVATEDLIWTFAKMGVATGIDLSRLLEAADKAATLPGACVGGRVRDALNAQTRREEMA